MYTRPKQSTTRVDRASSGITRRRVEQVDEVPHASTVRIRRDALATEEPLEIRLLHLGRTESLAVVMRTPGADFPLVAGFLFTEGILDSHSQVVAMRYCTGNVQEGPSGRNIVNVVVDPSTDLDLEQRRRSFYAVSSCGVCGKGSIEAVLSTVCGTVGQGPIVPAEVLVQVGRGLEPRQRIFARTGGLHAAALFDDKGQLLALHEDVGRHNAVDKLIGESWLRGDTPLTDKLMLVSGRLSFEVVQKAARAGVAVLAGVSAPSSLAVDLAEHFGMTLLGFLRGQRFNIYCGRERISGLPTPSGRRG